MDGEQGAEIVADTGGVETIEATEPVVLQTVEELATELGWKPKDQWKGAEDDFRDPAEFIKRGQHGRLIKEIGELKQTTERMARTAAATTARMLAEQEAEITARFEQAVEDGDKVAAAAATRELGQVQAQRNQPDPVVADFAARNPWYGTDPDATDYAAAISDRLARQGKSVAEQTEEAEKGVRKRFPELFDEPPPRRQAPLVSAPGSRTASPIRKERGAADLPAEARAAAKEFVAMHKTRAESRGGTSTYTEDDYAKTYWAEQAA